MPQPSGLDFIIIGLVLFAVSCLIAKLCFGGSFQLVGKNSNLIPCPDCGRMVSKLAKSCPRCGRPLESQPPVPSGSVAATRTDTAGKHNNGMALTGFAFGLASIFLYGIGIVPILGIVFSGLGLGTFKSRVEKNRWMAGVGLGVSIVFTLMFLFYRGR